MNLIKLSYIILSLLIFTSCDNKKNGDKKYDSEQSEFDRFTHDVIHYWDGFNFSDTTILSRSKQELEHTFAQWIEMSLALYYDTDSVYTGEVIKRAKINNVMLVRFMDMSETCLNDPNSPFRCEELYIPILREAINSSVGDEYKMRYRAHLETAMMNRKGTIASDFTYITVLRKEGTLHAIESPYTILYFFNPDCQDCARVSEIIATDGVLNALIDTDKLSILAIYPDEDLNSWNKHQNEFPKSWITGRYSNEYDREKYDLPAIPNLYLLDSEKRVIMKDAIIEHIIHYLANN